MVFVLGPLSIPFLSRGRKKASGLVFQTPALFEAFDTYDGVTAAIGTPVGTGAVVTRDTSDVNEGAASIEVAGGGSSGTATLGYDRTPATTYDPDKLGIMAFMYRLPNAIQQLNSMQVQIFRGASSAQYSAGMQAVSYPVLGWQWQQFDPTLMTGWSTVQALGIGTMRRRALISGTGPTRDIKFDAWYMNAKKGKSVVTINYDDGYTSQMTVAWPLQLARNLPFTLHCEYSLLTGAGSGANQRLTVGQVSTAKATYGSNMQICSQGDGVNFTDTGTYANAAAVITRLNAIKASFTTNGWVQGNNLKHISYPGGQTNNAITAALEADGGFLSARWVGSDNYFGQFGNHARKWAYPSWGTTSGGVFATLKAGLDLAISQGADFNVHFHDISSSAIGVTEAVLTQFLDYVVECRAAGKILVMNDPEWYAYRETFHAPFYVADAVPNTFTFTDVNDADLSTDYESNVVTVAGINAPTAVSIVGGQYRINGGAYTSSPGVVNAGDTVQAKAASSGVNSTAINVTLTIGGVADTFTVTTEADVPPVGDSPITYPYLGF
jgi:hypothetical protein